MTNTKPLVNEVGSAIEGGLKLAGDTFEQAASRVHEFHRAISDMPFKAVGTATLSSSKPIESVHNEITDLVYSAVKEVGKGVFNGAAWAVKQANQGLATQNRRPSRRVAAINSAINGLLGDHLSATRNPIEIKTGFYQDGHLLGLEQDELIQAFPDAKSSLVVFVHGLCCNEDSWFLYHKPEALHTVPYGPRLAHHFDVTPLYLRYNTALQISNTRGTHAQYTADRFAQFKSIQQTLPSRRQASQRCARMGRTQTHHIFQGVLQQEVFGFKHFNQRPADQPTHAVADQNDVINSHRPVFTQPSQDAFELSGVGLNAATGVVAQIKRG